jgi:hypothetical protein
LSPTSSPAELHGQHPKLLLVLCLPSAERESDSLMKVDDWRSDTFFAFQSVCEDDLDHFIFIDADLKTQKLVYAAPGSVTSSWKRK